MNQNAITTLNHHALSLPPPNPKFILLPILSSPHLKPLPRAVFGTSKGAEQLAVASSPAGNAGPVVPVFQNRRLNGVGAKTVDVSTLGNLCVDIVLNVPELPPKSRQSRLAYMNQLASSPPDQRYWEAGGNCNMAIAAARLGLRCASIGHVGNEIYGKFLLDVLGDLGVNVVEMSDETDDVDSSSAAYETLLCWVLVDPLQKHGFVSRADFAKEPAFNWLGKLSERAKMAIGQSKILFVNGYGFDELSTGMMEVCLDYAVKVGTSVFFDPGPRGKSLAVGTPEEKEALYHYLKMSDVLLLTSDEAESLTGVRNPILAGQELLRNGVRTKWVIVKLGSRGSIVVTASSVSCAPAFKVDVVDTVGCGDSFVAAIAFGFIHNLPLVDTLAVANAVGAATAMGFGAGRNVATLEQVLGLIRAANINEDDKFWNELLPENLNVQEVTFLSKTEINGSYGKMKRVDVQKVVCELLPKLEGTVMKCKKVAS